MSITAHYTEQYVLKYYFPRLNFRWLVVGSAFPNLFLIDRIFMFLIDTKMHRDYLFGHFHTLIVPLACSLLVWWIFGRNPGLCFLIGSWLHVLTDIFDELGVMLFWPITNTKYAVGIWPWSDISILYDWHNYFTTPASALFEIFFLVWAIIVTWKSGKGSFLSKAIAPWKSNPWNEKRKVK